jgi:DNA ligase-1
MARKTGGSYSYCETGGVTPDIRFNPQEVWQMAAADITSSPVYTVSATSLGDNRGVSLRFLRFISVREDKGIEEATTTEQLADMYEQQLSYTIIG